MKIANFIFRFNNKMLTISFDNYFTSLGEIYKYNTRQVAKSRSYYHSFNSEFGRKQLNHECLKLWESISSVKKECSFSKFKKVFKDNIKLSGYIYSPDIWPRHTLNCYDETWEVETVALSAVVLLPILNYYF